MNIKVANAHHVKKLLLSFRRVVLGLLNCTPKKVSTELSITSISSIRYNKIMINQYY